MSAKKIIIILVAAVVVACGVGYCTYTSTINTNKSFENENTQVSSSNLEKNSTSDNVNTENTTANNSKDNTASYNSSKAQVNNDLNRETNNTTSSKEAVDTSQIKWMLSQNENTTPNTVVIENTTGENISNDKLADYMREWILNSQYSYSKFADCNGTMWASQWLDTITNSQLVSYFESANGNEALSQSITASQLNKAAMLLSDTMVKEDYMPFSTAQATIYIKEMLKESYPNQVVTKVVFKGLYYVYTKQGGDSNPWWYVNPSTGYATGV